MKVFFTAWILVAGAWTHGSEHMGWSPLDAGSEAKCEQMLEFAKENSETESIYFTCEASPLP